MKLKKNELVFQSCNSEYRDSKVVLFSAPMDTTTSFRPGARFAGNAIRVDSLGIEWYSPYQNKSLKDYLTCDAGDLELTIGDVKKNLAIISDATQKIINDEKKFLLIGGEHLVTLGVIRTLQKRYPRLHIIHLDAHTDLREEFFGMHLSHATVIRRVHDLLGDNRIYQFGIRSGDKSEFDWSDQGHTYMERFAIDSLDRIIEKIKDEPVYITIDLDVLDPAYFPGTGTPEPGGITYKELLKALASFNNLRNIVGADIVELAPPLDSSGISNVVAAKTARELLLLLHK